MSVLGEKTNYTSVYKPSLLCTIERQPLREAIGITGSRLPFHGVDIWNAFEVSWLNPKGKPEVGMAEIHIPCASKNTVESKSLKLYLGSFNQTPFNNRQEVIQTIESDLSVSVQTPVMVRLFALSHAAFATAHDQRGLLLDERDIEIKGYQVNPELLQVDMGAVQSGILYSHLLKTNCPVTGQPDWATVFVHYRGHPINPDSLLRYIVSYRNHQDFHEACVERIFMDILRQCKPEQLSVYARYTRRGGIDINPFRSNFESTPPNIRSVRQ